MMLTDLPADERSRVRDSGLPWFAVRPLVEAGCGIDDAIVIASEREECNWTAVVVEGDAPSLDAGMLPADLVTLARAGIPTLAVARLIRVGGWTPAEVMTVVDAGVHPECALFCAELDLTSEQVIELQQAASPAQLADTALPGLVTVGVPIGDIAWMRDRGVDLLRLSARFVVMTDDMTGDADVRRLAVLLMALSRVPAPAARALAAACARQPWDAELVRLLADGWAADSAVRSARRMDELDRNRQVVLEQGAAPRSSVAAPAPDAGNPEPTARDSSAGRVGTVPARPADAPPVARSTPAGAGLPR